jgi:hypothetical protein
MEWRQELKKRQVELEEQNWSYGAPEGKVGWEAGVGIGLSEKEEAGLDKTNEEKAAVMLMEWM